MKNYFISNPFLSKFYAQYIYIGSKGTNELISISSSLNLNSNNRVKLKNKTFTGIDVSDILANGDKYLNENKFLEALNCYQDAYNKNPDEINVYKKMAKAQFQLKDYSSAIKNYEKYLSENFDDSEIWIELGEAQRKNGLYQKALVSFESALEIEPENDLARRQILETKNNILAIYFPVQARQEKEKYAQQNLQTALELTTNYMTPNFMKNLSGVQIGFGETAKMGGTSNIAQYENSKQAITISNSYIYAAPQVIAAYLSHEAIHAKDNDAYTSIREEQDAYEVATKFWIQNSNGIKDPEMDYAADLYTKSPSVLSKRVEEIYQLRDPSIAKTSPNHPPSKAFHFIKSKKNISSQPIKQYDFIA